MRDGGRPLWWNISAVAGIIAQVVLLLIAVTVGGQASQPRAIRIAGLVASFVALYFWIALLVVRRGKGARR